MSLAPYIFRPLTPPEAFNTAGQRSSSHSRNVSCSSSYMSNTITTPDFHLNIQTPPTRSPVYRQHGPTLLPKIRTQDNSLQPSAGQIKSTHKRALSNISNAPATYTHVRPPVYRCQTEPIQDCPTLMSPISNAPHSRASSLAPTLPSSRHHSRAVSSSSVDDTMLRRYGYPTYQQMPQYITQVQHLPSPPVFAQNYLNNFQQMSFLDPPAISLDGTFDMPIDIDVISRPNSTSPPPSLQPSLMSNQVTDFVMPGGPVMHASGSISTGSTSLLNYLTQPTQPVNLVRQLTFSTGRGLSSYFWWDVRNLRPWHSFSLSNMSNIPDLMTLLNFQHENSTFPSINPYTSNPANPTSETDLATLISKIHFPKVNAAAQLSLGAQNAPYLYLAPSAPSSTDTQTNIANTAQPTFLASYPNENQFTLTGSPRGRTIGIARSFDTFNSGMRHESPAQKVRYLKTFALLQKCMRDHSCRYGFIITEIELICVRAGSDKHGQPYFGYLEISESIATKTSAKYGVDAEGNYSEETPLTAGLALYYLCMLAKKVPFPGEFGSFMDVGGPGALTRQKVLPLNLEKRDASHTNNLFADGNGDGDVNDDEERKADGRDKWMPEPQVGEKRDAKTARGWVWPSDPWHKREGGRRSRRG